jgi:hypothetical protein
MATNEFGRPHTEAPPDGQDPAVAGTPRPPGGDTRMKRLRRLVPRRSVIVGVISGLATIATIVGGIVAILAWLSPDPLNRASPAKSAPSATVHALPTTSTDPGGATREGSSLLDRQAVLLSVVPEAMAPTCRIHSRDTLLRGALAVMQCTSKDVAVIRFGLFSDETSLYRTYWERVTGTGLTKDYGSNYCQDDAPAEQVWDYEGKSEAGRYFCYRDKDKRAWIEWTYNEQLVYAYAYHNDNSIQRIYKWWYQLP